MNGIHDLGGMHGMGPIDRDPDEPVFRRDWEGRVLALYPTTAVLGFYNIGEFRHAIERMRPVDYLQTSYYEHWLHALETLLIEKGVVTEDELATGHAMAGTAKGEPGLHADDVPKIVAHGASARVDVEVEPKFKEGDMVVVKNITPEGHTRMPRYVRDKLGCIDRDHGVFMFPDASAHGKGHKPQHCYSVYFSAQELWGPKSSRNDSVYVDLWDDHLVPA